MTEDSETELETARRHVQEAKVKFDRQQRRYAMLVLEGNAAAAQAKTLMAELEAEFEAGREALERLEGREPQGLCRGAVWPPAAARPINKEPHARFALFGAACLRSHFDARFRFYGVDYHRRRVACELRQPAVVVH